MRSLEREIDESSTRVTELAEALRKSGASIHDLLGKVERSIHTFPPPWQHVPQVGYHLVPFLQHSHRLSVTVS